MIEARALSKRYGGVPAVDGVTFTLPEGSRTALIGPWFAEIMLASATFTTNWLWSRCWRPLATPV